jgi:hypothetical protein
MSQHDIPDPPQITDRMTEHAPGTSAYDFVGERVVTVYNIPDSDRDEVLLHMESGRTFLVSCDPVVLDDNGVPLPPEDRGKGGWEVCFYDATNTEAGKVMATLEHGEWL